MVQSIWINKKEIALCTWTSLISYQNFFVSVKWTSSKNYLKIISVSDCFERNVTAMAIISLKLPHWDIHFESKQGSSQSEKKSELYDKRNLSILDYCLMYYYYNFHHESHLHFKLFKEGNLKTKILVATATYGPYMVSIINEYFGM